MIQDYEKMAEDLDQPFIWKKADHQKQENKTSDISEKRWTSMVFGETGHGKSTTLNKIVEIYSEKYNGNKDHACKFEG